MPYILNILIWFPIVAGGYMLLMAKETQPLIAKSLGLFTVLVTSALCVPLLCHFDSHQSGLQYVMQWSWIPSLGVHYALGIDGIALLMIVLCHFTTLIVFLATWNSIREKVAQYIAAFLILQGILVGVFASTDALMFYVFWEASLVPMYLVIGVWGSQNRVYAAIKFFLYTFLGSITLLVSVLYMGSRLGSYEISQFYALKLSLQAQALILLSFFCSFAVKIPMWPVHTWLPDAHTEAPTGGSIMLAAVLLKLGAYGFLRFALPITPDACVHYAWVMMTLSLIAIVYIGLVAIVQDDMKRLIAYSSISHMGFVTLGCFAGFIIMKRTGHFQDAGLVLEGAIVVMISHAFVSSGLFSGVGFIYDRMHTREISAFGGVINVMPIYAAFMMLFAMANAGLPGTSGFVGEFMVILGSIHSGGWVSVLAATTLLWGAGYTLWMYKRVVFGPVVNDRVRALNDLAPHEVATFTLLALAVLAMGIYPQAIIKLIHHPVQEILSLSAATKVTS